MELFVCGVFDGVGMSGESFDELDMGECRPDEGVDE